ncbi:GumC family protein [Zunongwangia profunda]|uniref:GumC family protein n=2 Tax=Zunongwangia profunda TaxID=398743 RepID=UPI00248F297B|nr:tyrosine-protein kinase family protein [Zunongwangia profunda]|tara:strand:- start:6798 stop:9164 length:2367 start_codon:yes stop_codon:yes gene_type:complete
MVEKENFNSDKKLEGYQTVDIREELKKYTKYWYWFVLSIIISLVSVFIYLRYTPKIYRAESKIIIKDSENPSAESAVLSEMGVMPNSGKTNIQNELAIIRSQRIMENVIHNLNLNVDYFAEGQVLDIEIYKESPLIAVFDGINGSPFIYKVKLIDGGLVQIKTENSGEEIFQGKLGDPIDLGFNKVTFYKTDFSNVNDEVLMQFSSINSTARKYGSLLSVSLSQDQGSILDLSIRDRVPEKAKDILNQLVEEYNQDAIRDNKIIADNTSNFINDRLDSINIELDSVEQNIENFKEVNGLINIETESEAMVTSLNEYRERYQDLNVQLELANSLKNSLQNRDGQLLPSNLGVEESGINALISQFNSLILERNKLLSGSSSQNPLVVDLNEQISSLRSNLFESLDRLIKNLNVSVNNVAGRLNEIRDRVASVPAKEREFRGVSRPQNIKEQLYLFLLQKREENSISYGVESIKAKIVDQARATGIVSPNSTAIILGGLLAGILIPFGIIFGMNFFDNKLRSKKDIENLIESIPVLGQIPNVGKEESDLIQKHDRSILAEAFRILTTSMQYVLAGIQNRDKKNTTIYVTSTVKGEGKTFTAFNLALTLCEGDNRVLIVGADLRNPQLQRYEEGAKVLKGVSDFIVSDDKSIKAYINQSKLHPNLSIVTSGSIPPNPSELLRNVKIDNMFKELKGLYDYVIVDTAPAMLVADTFLINRFADLTLYVARAGYTEKNLINFAVEAKESGKLTNVSFVLNDVKMSNFGYYGNKYGYTYAAEDNDKRKGLISRFKK